jgi:hypothetical protein
VREGVIETCKLAVHLVFSDALAFKSSALQLEAATWRSEKFSSIDDKVDADGVEDLIQSFAGAIIGELTHELKELTGQTSFPDSFAPGLECILNTAYDWNRIVKKDILQYDFQPYFVEPLVNWDPAIMEAFERRQTLIRPNTKVISTVSLGLVCRVSPTGARVSHVPQKARVLVEEWFSDGGSGRTMRARRTSSISTQLVPPMPQQRVPSYRAGQVATEPRPTPAMLAPAQGHRHSKRWRLSQRVVSCAADLTTPRLQNG